MLYFQPERMIVLDELLPRAVNCVLDLGCACGHITAYLLRTRAIDVTGVEINESLLEQARALYPGVKKFIAGSGTALPFEDGTFDAVVLLEVLEHVPDEQGLISEISRVLKPGGWLVLSVPNRSWISLIDLNRVKYYFPFLHEILYRLKHSGSSEGLRKELTNHRHYSLENLLNLFGERFEVTRHLYSGGAKYAMAVVASAFMPASEKYNGWRTEWLMRSFRRHWGRESFNLAVLAQRT